MTAILFSENTPRVQYAESDGEYYSNDAADDKNIQFFKRHSAKTLVKALDGIKLA